MSRGLGRWQRHLLHELYHNPMPPALGFPGRRIRVTRGLATYSSDDSAARRAARSLVAKGLATGGGSMLLQVVPAPGIVCPDCGVKCSEMSSA